MNKTWWAPLAIGFGMASAVACATSVDTAPPTNSREFVLTLPPEIDAGGSVLLVLKDVRLPKSAAVVLRARLVESSAETPGAEIPLGSIGVMAESKDAEGTATHAVLRIDITQPLLRWRQEHAGATTVRIRVAPFAGKEPIADLEWSAASAALTLNAR